MLKIDLADFRSIKGKRNYLDLVLSKNTTAAKANTNNQTPLILLGAGSVYAKHFIDFALRNLNVV